MNDVRVGRLLLELGKGHRREFRGSEPGPAAHVIIRRPRAVRRFLLGGAIGAAESYVDGDWDTPDLSATLEFFVRNEAAFGDGYKAGAMLRVVRRIYHHLRANTRRGSRRNIAAHYDLGNDFYRSWLDGSMTYSSAIFAEEAQPLEHAQAEKYSRICDRLELGPDHHLLEIGCGWGGFAEHAAATTGCRVTAVTISQEQFDHARRRVFEAGLGDRVSVNFTDYRDIEGSFDRVASIEMFEAVGERYWPVFFRKVRDGLSAGGRAALQIITIDDAVFERYRRGTDFIQRYIFPGGLLPSREALMREVEQAGLTWRDDAAYGQHYADTLAAWRRRFETARSKVDALGYPERFRRLWDFYLAYCEAGFRSGRTNLLQISLGPA